MTVSEERRRYDRLPMRNEIQFRRVKQTAQTIRVHDLCPAGCRISTAVTLLEGERGWVRLPGLESIPSTTRWAGEWIAGVSFDRPIHPAVFATLAKRLQHG